MAARFNIEWMSKEEYKDWLLPEDSDNTKARCKLCRKTFSLSNVGEPSLKSHAQGKKHQSTGGSRLSRTAVKPDSCLARIFVAKFLCIIKLIIITG